MAALVESFDYQRRDSYAQTLLPMLVLARTLLAAAHCVGALAEADYITLKWSSCRRDCCFEAPGSAASLSAEVAETPGAGSLAVGTVVAGK